ncbi:orotidine-5'-phosphate decarboxylase, partial [Aureobasidium melanogenum]
MSRHATITQSYQERASLPKTSPVASYLLRLIAAKQTNLCVSADVSTTRELLQLAEEVGDSICMLKTHADIINDFGPRTIQGLKEIAAKKHFLVFEDRKFGDIGSTVQKQFTAGPLQIVRWANIINAHIFPGPAIIT